MDRGGASRPKLFQQGDYRNEGQIPENLSSVEVPLKMVSVSQKLGTR
jgi:hypothetical protein